MRCTATRKIRDENGNRKEAQCVYDANHEGWHKCEHYNAEGTYKKTDVYLWPKEV